MATIVRLFQDPGRREEGQAGTQSLGPSTYSGHRLGRELLVAWCALHESHAMVIRSRLGGSLSAGRKARLRWTSSRRLGDAWWWCFDMYWHDVGTNYGVFGKRCGQAKGVPELLVQQGGVPKMLKLLFDKKGRHVARIKHGLRPNRAESPANEGKSDTMNFPSGHLSWTATIVRVCKAMAHGRAAPERAGRRSAYSRRSGHDVQPCSTERPV